MLLESYVLLFIIFAVLYIYLKQSEQKNDEEIAKEHSFMKNKDTLSFLKAIPVFLALIFSFLLQNNRTEIYPGIFFALLFCLLGDFFIDRNLIQGMLFFSMAHIFLIISFIYALIIHFSNLLTEDFLALLLLTGLIFIYNYAFIRYLIALKIPENYNAPVVIYSLLLSTMFSSAVWLAYILRVGELIILPLGALLFLVSDSLIAIREFGSKNLTYSTQKIMGLYYSAILLISLSILYV